MNREKNYNKDFLNIIALIFDDVESADVIEEILNENNYIIIKEEEK
jgi:hypothetical protein